MKFQSLIGRLRTQLSLTQALTASPFQSLIGRLRTPDEIRYRQMERSFNPS